MSRVRGHPPQAALSPQKELRLQLLSRIGEYKARGWVDALEEAEFVQFLERSSEFSDDVSTRDADAAQVKRTLDFIRRRREEGEEDTGRKGGFPGDETDVCDSVRETDRGGIGGRNGRANGGSEDYVRGDGGDKDGYQNASSVKHSSEGEYLLTRRGGSDGPCRRVVGDNIKIGTGSRAGLQMASDADVGRSPESLSGETTDAKLRDLFVEMCFFARLGFLQPPSCLRCAYSDARMAKAKGPDQQQEEDDDYDGQGEGEKKWRHCARPIVWRKDATRPLHPEQLGEGGLLVLKCRMAEAWLRGDVRGGLRWDPKRRKLISVKE